MNFYTSGTGTAVGDGFRVGFNGTEGQLFLFEDADFRIATNAVERFRIKSDGKVGIGTSSPSAELHLSATAPVIKTTATNTNSGLRLNIVGGGNELLRIQNDGSEVMRIDSSGRVMVGTTTAGGILSLDNTGQTSETLLQLEDTGGSGAHSHISLKNTTGVVASLLTTSDNLEFRVDDATVFSNISGTEHMRISNTGDVMIATNSTYDGAMLTVNAPSGSVHPLTVRVGLVSDGFSGVIFRNPNGIVGSIAVNSSSTSYNTSSDYRLKENLVDIEDATSRLKQLKPKRFNFIANADTTVDGFIAHEVQTVVPEAITGTKDAVDADGNPEYQGIDQSKLVPLLVKTIQELEARITTLEANNP
jgi:hypothetical protein